MNLYARMVQNIRNNRMRYLLAFLLVVGRRIGKNSICGMNVNIADALTSVILVIILVPKFGVNGYIFTIYFTEILNTTLSLARMIAITKPKLRIFGHVFGPILCIAVATGAVRLLCSSLSLQDSAWTLVLQIALSALLYVGLLAITRCIGTDEYEMMRAILKPGCYKASKSSAHGIVAHKPRVD